MRASRAPGAAWSRNRVFTRIVQDRRSRMSSKWQMWQRHARVAAPVVVRTAPMRSSPDGVSLSSLSRRATGALPSILIERLRLVLGAPCKGQNPAIFGDGPEVIVVRVDGSVEVYEPFFDWLS